MSKAVLTTATGSIYDDRPELRYHFPQTYLRQVQDALDDFIVYYEPRRDAGPSSRGGRQAYFAWARITAVDPDLVRVGHWYARVSDYTEFDHPVPFHDGQRSFERILTKADGSTNRGAFGRAVRTISDDEFARILAAGFDWHWEPWEREFAASSSLVLPATDVATVGIAADSDAPAAYVARPRIDQVLSRPFRDIAFRRHVRAAYANTCAVTGLRLINGGGRPEVQAAHIRPVEADGPDAVRNGLALTGTAHWLFDRGLISVSDDYQLLVSPHGVPNDLQRLLPHDRRLFLPAAAELRPHPVYLRWHREHRFKH